MPRSNRSRAVLEGADQPLARIFHRQGEIEARCGTRRIDQLEVQIAEPQRVAMGLQQREAHLHERVLTEHAFRLDGLDDAIERDILMVVGRTSRVTDTPHEAGERGISRQVRPHRQHVGEEADEPLERLPRSIRHGRADRKVGLAAVAEQQHTERRQKRHEERRALAPAQILESIGKGPRQAKPFRGAGIARPKGTRMIGREVQRWHAGERPFPERDMHVQ